MKRWRELKSGSQKNLFCMTDSKEGWLIRNLSFGEVLAVLATRPRRADDELLFWTEDWDSWKGIDEPECQPFRALRVENQNPPPVPLIPIYEDTLPPPTSNVSETTMPRLQLSEAKASQRPKIPPPKGVFAPVETSDSVAVRPQIVPPPPLSKPVGKPSSAFVGSVTKTGTQTHTHTHTEVTDSHGTKTTGSAPRQPRTESVVDSKRKYVRFVVQIPVIIQTTTEQFNTSTLDVSEGGIRLQEALPERFAGYSQVVLMPANHEPLHLLASLVEDQQDGRFHLQFLDSPAQAVYINWLRQQDWAQAS